MEAEASQCLMMVSASGCDISPLATHFFSSTSVEEGLGEAAVGEAAPPCEARADACGASAAASFAVGMVVFGLRRADSICQYLTLSGT